MIIAICANRFFLQDNLLFVVNNSFISFCFVFRLLKISVLIKFPQCFTSSSARSVKIMSKHKFFSSENILLLAHEVFVHYLNILKLHSNRIKNQ